MNKAAEVAKRLEEHCKERAELVNQLRVSMALEEAFPDIFEKGGVKIAVMGPDSTDPHVRITFGDESHIRKELDEMPLAWLEANSKFIEEQARTSRYNQQFWRKAADRLKLA
jgi:siroheme synthase (precorrin-2 oxidase/ferrochelatase)